MNIFLSTCFSSKVDAGGEVHAEYREMIQARIDALRAQGHNVFCVIEHRGWKMLDGETKGAEVGFDIEKIRESDCVVAILGDTVSAGLQWECGFATGIGMKVFVWPESENTKLKYWNEGLIELGDMTLISAADQLAE